MTPNRVTVLGAIILYSGVFVLMYYGLTLTERMPDWVYLYFGLCVFLGQTFDAIDGKHARNTKRGSPLGQLMDHGCDALTNSCHSLFLGASWMMGRSPHTILIIQVFVHVRISFISLIFSFHNGKNI